MAVRQMHGVFRPKAVEAALVPDDRALDVAHILRNGRVEQIAEFVDLDERIGQALDKQFVGLSDLNRHVDWRRSNCSCLGVIFAFWHHVIVVVL